MSRKAAHNRLTAVERAIDGLPFQPQAVHHAYAQLLTTGALPADDRLAWVVLDRALYARRETVGTRSTESRPWPAPSPIQGSPRRQVFREAVHDFKPARMAARTLISHLVAAGMDPTAAEFIPPDLELPAFGSAALHALGWPDHWVLPAHERQMQRVLCQHAEVRERCDRSDRWYREAAAGLSALLTRGTLPVDDLVRMFALTIGEMFAIHACYVGRGNEELLAAFDTVATGSAAERECAIQRLGPLQVAATEALR